MGGVVDRDRPVVVDPIEAVKRGELLERFAADRVAAGRLVGFVVEVGGGGDVDEAAVDAGASPRAVALKRC